MESEGKDFVSEFEDGLRKVEGELETLGRSICSKPSGVSSWGAINRAVEAVQDAIHTAYKMRGAR